MMKVLSEVRCFDGRQLRIEHESKSCNCTMVFSLFLPPAARTARVPVLWWLSGLTCNDQNFVTKAGAQRVAAELGIAIVAPDTSPRGEGVADDPDASWDFGLAAGFYINATQEPFASHYQMQDYIQQELPELLQASEYKLDWQRQGICGHSMGGHGALTLGLKFPDQYQSISAFAPICAPTQCPWGEKAFTGYLGGDSAQWRAHDASALIAEQGYDRPLLVTQGEADNFMQPQLKPELLQQACEQKAVELQLDIVPGYDHSYFFIATFIEQHLRFHYQQLS